MKYGHKIDCKIVPIFFQLKPSEININNNKFTCNVIYIFVMYVDAIEQNVNTNVWDVDFITLDKEIIDINIGQLMIQILVWANFGTFVLSTTMKWMGTCINWVFH